MKKKGTFIKNTHDIREIWVQREDDIIEYKLWVIFQVSFKELTQEKISSFLETENHRFEVTKLFQDKKQLFRIAPEYTNLETNVKSLPPRLMGISENDLNALDTELFTDKNDFVYGDSIGGISPNKPSIHNKNLLKSVKSSKKILLNPGVLARIEINNKKRTYIFQLAEKNLRSKNQIFYKPIGGHLKYKEPFNSLIKKFNLELKNRIEEQDTHDLSLYVNPNNFLELSKILKKELISEKEYYYIEDPRISIYRELQEELGPIFASDGISLLDKEDLELFN